MNRKNRPRKDARVRVTLYPDVYDWLESATAERSDTGMYRDRMLNQALRYYMSQPGDALDYDGRRVCCGTDGTVNPATGAPRTGHRGTCRYSAMRGGPDSTEYRALTRMWQAQGGPGVFDQKES